MKLNYLWICPDTELSGLCPQLSTALGVGLFGEKEEGIGIASNVVKVEGEDPATPGSVRGHILMWHGGDPFRGYVLLGPPLRKPLDRNNSPILV